MDDANADRIVEELRKQTRINVRLNAISGIGVILFLIGYGTLVWIRHHPPETKQEVPVWTRINEASTRHDKKEEIRLLGELLNKNRNDYYVHSCIAYAYAQQRDLENAKKHFEISYKLFPIDDTKQKLAAVNKALGER